MTQRYLDRKKAGLCTNCGEPAELARTKCTDCLLKYRHYGKTPEARAKNNACHRARHARDPEQYNASGRQSYRKLRDKIYARYGNKCACCDDTTPEFLSIDHTRKDGKAHRASLGMSTTGSYSYLKAIWEDPDPTRFRLLCFNCNCSRGMRGYCPHERLSRDR